MKKTNYWKKIGGQPFHFLFNKLLLQKKQGNDHIQNKIMNSNWLFWFIIQSEYLKLCLISEWWVHHFFKIKRLLKAQLPELSVTWFFSFLSFALSINRMKPHAWLKIWHKPVRHFMLCNGNRILGITKANEDGFSAEQWHQVWPVSLKFYLEIPLYLD